MSSGKTAAIPSTQGLPPETRRVLDPLIESVESIKGRRRAGKIKALPASASLADVIAKINEVLERLQA